VRSLFRFSCASCPQNGGDFKIKRRGGVEGAEERPQLAERFAVGDFAPGPAQPFPQPVGFGVVTFAQVAVEFELLVGQTALDSGLGPPPTQIPFNEYRAASSDLTPPGASNGERIMAEENLQGNPAGGRCSSS
jgi:hypothetical protein